MDNEFINNLVKNLKSSNTSNNSDTSGTNTINPDMLKNIMSMFNNSNTNNSNTSNINNNFSNSNDFNNDSNFDDNSSGNNFFNNDSNNSEDSNNSIPNIDINMLFKIKSIMDKMNENKNDPRSNLLRSLKPYLKKSRQDKIEQYVQLFSVGQIINAFNQNGGENTK